MFSQRNPNDKKLQRKEDKHKKVNPRNGSLPTFLLNVLRSQNLSLVFIGPLFFPSFVSSFSFSLSSVMSLLKTDISHQARIHLCCIRMEVCLNSLFPFRLP